MELLLLRDLVVLIKHPILIVFKLHSKIIITTHAPLAPIANHLLNTKPQPIILISPAHRRLLPTYHTNKNNKIKIQSPKAGIPSGLTT